jgi:oxygen-independent coproporphyrinogen-3 oxidase
MNEYHSALKKEIERFAHAQIQKNTIDTIFFGGGTPSTYPEPLLLDMFGTLRTCFTITQDAEISIEVNPGTVTLEKLSMWKEVGISRLSIGVQSLNDNVLTRLNRLQSKRDVYNLLDAACKLFDNLSIDLIVGLPGITSEEWKDTVAQVVTWPIKHVSVYFLSIHENTPLYFGVKAKKITLPCDDEVVDLYCWTAEQLANAGFQQYEISNFAKPGYESRHNAAYWERKPYKGFGLGACSFDGLHRMQNQKNLMSYIKDVADDKDITVFAETLTREQIFLEKVMLGLRQTSGISFATLCEGLTQGEIERLYNQIGWLRDNNLINIHDNRIVLTAAGLAVENEIVVKLSL